MGPKRLGRALLPACSTEVTVSIVNALPTAVVPHGSLEHAVDGDVLCSKHINRCVSLQAVGRPHCRRKTTAFRSHPAATNVFRGKKKGPPTRPPVGRCCYGAGYSLSLRRLIAIAASPIPKRAIVPGSGMSLGPGPGCWPRTRRETQRRISVTYLALFLALLIRRHVKRAIAEDVRREHRRVGKVIKSGTAQHRARGGELIHDFGDPVRRRGENVRRRRVRGHGRGVGVAAGKEAGI